MRFAVITDIHGNGAALKAVLSDINQRNDVDHIYCLGDMIAIGPDTNEVLDMLFSRTDVSMITGNHDEAVLSLLKDEVYPRSHLHVYPHHDWIATRMDPIYVPKLESLPRVIQKTINNKSLLFTHYHMEKTKITKHISEDPFSEIKEPSLENLEKLFKNNKEHLICFGHHHPVHFFSNDKTIFLNPGSLGCYDKPIARYGIVTISNDKIDVKLRELVYDNNEFLRSYDELKVTDRQLILEIFHGNQPIG
ncbi:metallophosphoesterase family protein [Aquibacillus halophilus]|uniref:metallophosphoesterase family protein n=1 Tax=Aquibacillus halophilus TaxID=930132 RepID=UPI0030B80436